MAWVFQPEYYSKHFRGVPVDARHRLKTLIAEKCVLQGDFLLASGQRSQVFFDCKRVTLDPEGLHLIAGMILDLIDDLARRDGRPIEAIGGPTIGADPVVGHVAGLSWERATQGSGTRSTAALRPLRGFLVRKSTKDHGTGRLIENDIPKGSRVVIFEDVVTTGGSTLEAIARAEEAGLEVAAVVAVVDREQGGETALARYRYHPLFKKSEFGL
jgi:orotate phosphoribosyltransferase